MPEMVMGDSIALAPFASDSGSLLRVPLPPRPLQLQPIARKYGIEVHLQSVLRESAVPSLQRFAAPRARVLAGRRMARVAAQPQIGRQDRLSRYAYVLGLMRLSQDLQVVRSGFLRFHAPRPKQKSTTLYRRTRGFPVFAAGDGEPALHGFLAHPVTKWASVWNAPLRSLDDALPSLCESGVPVLPASAIPRAMGVTMAPPAAGIVTVFVGEEAHRIAVAPADAAPLQATIPPLPQVAEPWALARGFMANADSVQEIAASLPAPKFQLRDRRGGFGLHVPQPMLRPLRPRLLISDTDTGIDNSAPERESGVVSILSLRAALGSRR